MHQLVDIFSKRVKHHMENAPVVVTTEENVSALAEQLTASNTSVGLVVTQEHRLVGIVTGQDLIGSISGHEEFDFPVAEIMASPVHCIHSDDCLYHARRHMTRFGLSRMPVVDSAQRPIGLISTSDLMLATSKTVMDYARCGSDQDHAGGLKQIKDAQADLAEQLLSDRITAPDTQIILSEVNKYIHNQVLDNVLIEILQDGWGQLPVPFAAVIMGSGGRRESFLNPDQDNAFILADYPEEKHGAIDPFFIELAERLTIELDRIGIPFCKGYIMATNPAWRKTTKQWQQQLSYWKHHPSPVVVRQADIFFDFQPFFGAENLSFDLRHYVSEFTQSSPGFLRDMHSLESSQLGVALSLFGRLKSETDDTVHESEVNLKYGALLPLTQSVRLLALREGIEVTSTLDRINCLCQMGKIDSKEGHNLTDALSILSGVLLRQQIVDLRESNSLSYYVPLSGLSQWERDEVVASLKSIANFRDRVDQELTGRV